MDAVRRNGVVDLDGALRGSDWQLAYTSARSFRDGEINFSLARSAEYDAFGNPRPSRMHIIGQTTVLKVNYLYYF